MGGFIFIGEGCPRHLPALNTFFSSTSIPPPFPFSPFLPLPSKTHTSYLRHVSPIYKSPTSSPLEISSKSGRIRFSYLCSGRYCMGIYRFSYSGYIKFQFDHLICLSTNLQVIDEQTNQGQSNPVYTSESVNLTIYMYLSL